MGVGPGDVVPVSTLTFAASVNAIRYVGAEPYFIDSEAESGNISPALLDEALTTLAAAGRRVPCVIPVDLLGKCADYTRVIEVAKRHGVRVLADAAESLGARHSGAAGRWIRGGSRALLQRQQGHDHVRWRHAAHRRRALGSSTCASSPRRPGSRCRITNTPRSATTTGSRTSSLLSDAPNSSASTR